MKVLIIGSGGREHALAWKCAQSPRVAEVLVAPGNAGTAREDKTRNVAVSSDDTEALATLARQEVFGPVLGVTPFEDEAEAVRIANSTVYGLAGAVWTSNLSRAHRMIRAVRTGVMHVNTYGGADGTVPLGGVGQSGNGHDKSLHALDKYCDLKTAWIQL